MATKMRVVRGDVDVSEDASGDRGRRVETHRDLEPGDLALTAKALAVVLLPELWGSHCHKCFSSGMRLSRCGRCRTAFYCSRQCQQEDWEPDHRKECKSLAQLASLGLRSDQVADVLLLGRVMRREEVDGVKPQGLVWYQEDMEDQELVLLAALAQKLKLVEDSCAMDELQRMLSRFRNNNFSICDELLLELGAGCFPLGAMINHSCEPNCAVAFVSKTLDMEFRAMTPVKAGQEVTQTYVDIALPRHERQQRLQRKYHFHCECARCSVPLQESGDLDVFLDADIDGVPQDQWSRERHESVQRALKDFSDDTGRAGGQQQPNIDALQKLLDRQNEILHRDNIARLQTLSTLFSAEMERESVEEAVQYGEHVLEFYRRVYHSDHPMTGLHLFTLGDLYGQMVQMGTGPDNSKAKASEYLAEAQRILRITHGKDHRFVKMLADRLHKAPA